ncbi:uncharacterized protein LOC17879026 [Capsella rubella]|nr:uncharacterized protein LOC17879026 [Capsella rubella]
MAQLIINRVFKPSVCKNILRHTNVRMFSSTTHFSSQPAYPFLLIDYILNFPQDGRVITCISPYKANEVRIHDKELIKEVCDAMTVGFSRDGLGYRLSWNRVVITYNPSDPELDDVTVDLPSLPTFTKIHNLTMSSLPVRDKDWVVGVKLSGSRISLCRPYGSSKWINIKAKCINPNSTLMFSKTDQRFYIPGLGGNFLCYLDLNSKENDQTKFIEMQFDKLPKSVFEKVANLSSCSKTDHLVESPTGQLFLVKWYGADMENYESKTLQHVTEKFTVFRANEKSEKCYKTMTYTEDIGDLCIFVGHSEAFCVLASSSRGLKPNCIYFVGRNFGVYDLTTGTCTHFLTEEEVPIKNSRFPYWPCPSALY